MKRTLKLSAILCLIALTIVQNTFSKEHGKAKEIKKGILLVTFGSTKPEAQKAFSHIEEEVKAAFPETPFRWAYTSNQIRKILAKQGNMLDSPEVALSKMMDEGFTHVAVQSLHTITGIEFHEMCQNAMLFEKMSGGFEKITIGLPLLGSSDDMERATNAIVSMIPKERKKKEAVILMGHGTYHSSNEFYTALMYRVQQLDPLIYVGTVEGSYGIDSIIKQLKKHKTQKAYIMPFMSVAGDHALNDMAGEEGSSWKSILQKEKITPCPILKGTAEINEFVSIWLDHLKVAYEQL